MRIASELQRLRIEYWPIGRLKPYERNPRKNDKALDRIRASIREFGFAVPILAKSDGEVIDGHLRLKGAWADQMREVPVIPRGSGCHTINPRDLMSRRGSIRGFTLWALNESEISEIQAGILAGLENGTLRPVVGKEIALAEAARAHREVTTSGASGKIILVP